MLTDTLHREDIKAVLRKRHGTVQRFAISNGIKAQAVADFLRGRTSKVVKLAIERELQADRRANSRRGVSINLDISEGGLPGHRQNARAA